MSSACNNSPVNTVTKCPSLCRLVLTFQLLEAPYPLRDKSPETCDDSPGAEKDDIMIILWIALIVVLVVFATQWQGRTNGQDEDPGPAETLRLRYARGEISTAEFEDRRQNLRTDR